MMMSLLIVAIGCEEKPVRQGQSPRPIQQKKFDIYDINEESKQYLADNYPAEDHALIRQAYKDYMKEEYGSYAIGEENTNGAAVQAFKAELIKLAELPQSQRFEQYKAWFENPIYERRKAAQEEIKRHQESKPKGSLLDRANKQMNIESE